MKELNLKVGDKVFDSFYFEGIEGIVKEFDSDPEILFPYKIYFGAYFAYYSTCGIRINGGKPTLSLEPYEVNLNIVTEKQETFGFGDKVLDRGEEVVFVSYWGKNESLSLLITRKGNTFSTDTKNLTKVL